MQILVLSLGKDKKDYLEIGVTDYLKRINRFVPIKHINIVPPQYSNDTPIEKRITMEASLVIKHIKKEDQLIILDEKGKLLSSPALSDWINKQMSAGSRKLIFLIGGAYGILPALKEQAYLQWSLSPLVFPHRIATLMVVEQIYRAMSIINNEKYHHE